MEALKGKMSRTDSPQKVIVVGQLPPPHLGQSLQLERIVRHDFEKIEIIFVPWSFNRDARSYGRFSLIKVVSLLAFCRRLREAIRSNEDAIFYLPAAPGTWYGLLRDFVIMHLGHGLRTPARVLAFHAAGQADFVSKTNLRSRLARLTYSKAALGIVNTEDSRCDARALGCCSVAVVPYGISDPRADLSGDVIDHAVMPGRPFVLYVGKVCEEKGVFELIEAFQELSDRYPDLDLRLAGPSTEEFDSFLEAYALKRPQVFERIVLEGPLAPEEISDIYRQASIFCFPSRAPYESFGLVVVEAMSHSLPIVASRWRGIPHMIEDEVSGILHQPGDSQDLVRCLDAVLRSPALGAKLGSNARHVFDQRYSEAVYWRDLESALLSVRRLK